MNAKSAKRPAHEYISLATVVPRVHSFEIVLIFFLLASNPTTLLGEFRLGLAVGDPVASAHQE
jgi:hypothetical protein